MERESHNQNFSASDIDLWRGAASAMMYIYRQGLLSAYSEILYCL